LDGTEHGHFRYLAEAQDAAEQMVIVAANKIAKYLAEIGEKPKN
jgi:hypothetical protein